MCPLSPWLCGRAPFIVCEIELWLVNGGRVELRAIQAHEAKPAVAYDIDNDDTSSDHDDPAEE
jgi:hypothetical protein